MQPVLESFESFFYVLVNTLPVGIGIGLLFFGIGFLFANPRIKRLRQQIANYREEIQRMSRRQAQVTTQHQELLENLQGTENEKLALQSSLETKNDELIDLLDRLNNIAGDAEPAAAIGDSESTGTENTKLRKRIAELTGRLRTSESALQDRKIELARARNELARVGIPQEATTTGGGSTGGGSSGGDQGWHPGPSMPTEEEDLPHSEDAADAADAAKSSAMQDAVDALIEQQAGPDIASSDPESPTSGENLDATAARIFSGLGDDKAQHHASKKEKGEGKEKAPAAEASKKVTSSDKSKKDATPEEQTNDLEDQFADFEERLRAKEAEFFALQEQLSFHPIDPAKDSRKDSAKDSPKAPAKEAPSAASSDFANNKVTPAEKTPASTDDPKSSTSPSETGSPFPPLTDKKAPLPPLQNIAPATAPSKPLAPGEQLIFRGSDPSLWGKQTGGDFVDHANIDKSTKFLRLRRSDTGQSIIVHVAKKQVTNASPDNSLLGWNGKGEAHGGVAHLGIYDHSLPQEVETLFGVGGWGFGHHTDDRSGQGYSWAGISIPRTEFEISTLAKLPDAETLKKTDTTFLESPSFAPSTDDELVFFHSSHPEIWNKNTVDGKGGFALNLSRTPLKTRFLQVRRTDNGDSVIIPISRDKIVTKSGGEKQLGWNGANEFFSAGHHLGIADPAAEKEVEISHGCGGYGFGHLIGLPADRQAITWVGKAISRIPLEFTAIARELSSAEKENLLKS